MGVAAAGPGGAVLRLSGGETLWASQVVLALGNSAGPTAARAPGVTVRPRGGRAAGAARPSDDMVLEAGAVIRCTGPSEHLASLGDPLLDGLFAVGDARPGPLGLGLAVDPDGRLLDRFGQPSESLWTIGPLRRGALLETTAIPEIREQAAALARTLPEAAVAAELGYALEEAL